jgi:ribosomal protein L12E/L44/L45/RPP1/RPP2
MEQWADKQQQQAASTSAAVAAQMPFLALLQGAGVVMEAEEEQQHDGRKRQAFARAVSDLDLLESCVTQAVAPTAAAAAAPVASRTERRRKRPRPRARAAPPPEKRRKPEEAESQRMTHIAVERNRRRLMNDHLASLRSLIPSSYIPRVSQSHATPMQTRQCCVPIRTSLTMQRFACRATRRQWWVARSTT